ncbi:hypothetical protein OG943_03840 [Amycolatopsis sp. NBC_00345]|uniref:hypothetical protein n=1 Tax=Amycolatopsis sp. NBC_00345 TaxID=2975955 RepID=UPI002E270E62
MSVVEPITSSNSTSGAGAIDSWHSVASAITEIKTAHGADAAAIGVEIGVTVIGAIADTAALVLDPLAKLTSAGLGWLIEHISFLKEPLDQVAGDPAEIKKLAEELHKIGETLRNSAKDLDAALAAQITNWKGEGYDAFKKEVDTRRGQIEDSGHSVDIAGYVVETTMALVTAVRSLLRDLITTILGDIIATVLVGLAMAAFTFGASLVAAVGTSVALAAAQAVSFAAKLAKLMGLGERTVGRLVKLSAQIKPLPKTGGTTHELTPITPHPGGTGTPHTETPPGTRPPTPHEEAPPTPHNDTPEGSPPPTPHEETPPGSPHNNEDDVFNDWVNADNHLNGPPHTETPPGTRPPTPHDDAPPTPHDDAPPTPHDDAPTPHDDTPTPHDDAPTPHDEGTNTAGDHTDVPPPAKPPEPQSPLKPWEIKKMKAHEDWLKGASWDKVKWVENQFKTNPKLQKYYPVMKGLSDAKSSKNFVGWVGKDFVNVDKALTDIQMQADTAWADSDKKWREEHPDPAATDPGQQKA